MQHQKILILDFGSQVTQLIARRVREAHVFCEVHPCDVTSDWVRDYVKCLAMVRPRVSELPPGAYGTISLIGRCGQSCAWASAGCAAHDPRTAQVRTTINWRRQFMGRAVLQGRGRGARAVPAGATRRADYPAEPACRQP